MTIRYTIVQRLQHLFWGERKIPYVYAIGSPVGLTKIGVASAPEQRLAALQTGSPVKLHLIGSIAVGSRIEAVMLEGELHKRFKQFAVHGEWFSLPADEIEQLFNKPKQAPRKSRVDLVFDFYRSMVVDYSERAKRKLMAQLNVTTEEELIPALANWQMPPIARGTLSGEA